MRILAVSGSLRESSFNSSLLRAALEATPEGVELELWEGLVDLPLYHEDLEHDVPESVRHLREDWAAAERLVGDDVVRRHTASGTPAQVRERLAAYRAAGLDEIVLGGLYTATETARAVAVALGRAA